MEPDPREPCPLGLTDEQARKRLWVEAEVQRLEALGATRYDHQQERGFGFWVMRDPWATSSAYSHRSSPGSWPSVGHGRPSGDSKRDAF